MPPSTSTPSARNRRAAFIWNMLGALILTPALARLLLNDEGVRKIT